MRSITQKTEAVVYNLKKFLRIVHNSTSYSLDRINSALIKIKQLADSDIGAMKEIVNAYKQSYDSHLGNRLDHILYFLDYAEHNLNHLGIRLESDLAPHSELLYPYGDHSVGYAWDSFAQAKGAFNVLWQSLSDINGTNRMMKMRNFSDPTKVSLPDRLWAGPTREENCLDLIKLELEGYQDLVTIIPETLHSWTHRDQGSSWSDAMMENMLQRRGNVTSLKSCVGEYKGVITAALDNISTMKIAAEKVLKSDTHLDLHALESSIGEHITTINQSASVLRGQLELYCANKTSKMYLAGKLLNTSIRDIVRRRMESLISKTDLDAISKLQTETEEVESSVQNWFITSFDSLTTLVDYFGDDVIIKLIQTLNLWRKPTVDFRTPDVIRYTYESIKSWETLFTSTYQVNITTLTGSHRISSILDGYMAGINGALYEVQHTLLSTKEEAMSAFDALWHELEAYRQQGQIDDGFVRYVICELCSACQLSLSSQTWKHKSYRWLVSYTQLSFDSQLMSCHCYLQNGGNFSRLKRVRIPSSYFEEKNFKYIYIIIAFENRFTTWPTKIRMHLD